MQLRTETRDVWMCPNMTVAHVCTVGTTSQQSDPFNSLFFQDKLGKQAPERLSHSGF